MNEQEPQQPEQPRLFDSATEPCDPPEPVGEAYDYEAEANDRYELERIERARDAEQRASEDEEEQKGLPHEQPLIWVGSWLDYNNGILHGEWINAARAEEDIHDRIQDMLTRSPTARRQGETAEEWGIFDYEHFGPLRIREQEDISWVAKVARGVAKHGPAFAAYADVMEKEDSLDGFTDSYLGRYESAEDFADQLIEDLGYNRMLDSAVEEKLRWYVRFDTAAFARDLELDGAIQVMPAQDGGVWVFQMQ